MQAEPALYERLKRTVSRISDRSNLGFTVPDGASGRLLGGALGGIVGAFGGYQVRTRLVRALKVPDIAIALAEDAVAIGVGFLIVSRF